MPQHASVLWEQQKHVARSLCEKVNVRALSNARVPCLVASFLIQHLILATATLTIPTATPLETVTTTAAFPNPSFPPYPPSHSQQHILQQEGRWRHRWSHTYQPRLSSPFLLYSWGQREGPQGWLLMCEILQEQPQRQDAALTPIVQTKGWKGAEWKE